MLPWRGTWTKPCLKVVKPRPRMHLTRNYRFLIPGHWIKSLSTRQGVYSLQVLSTVSVIFGWLIPVFFCSRASSSSSSSQTGKSDSSHRHRRAAQNDAKTPFTAIPDERVPRSVVAPTLVGIAYLPSMRYMVTPPSAYYLQLPHGFVWCHANGAPHVAQQQQQSVPQ